jgi:hypothetical protein
MRRRVLTAVLVAALSLAAMPGFAAAAGGNSLNAKNCQTNYAGFKNRGQCTSYYAKLQDQLRAQTRGVPPGLVLTRVVER